MTQPAARPPYQLTHDPDGTSWTARENLADVLRRELLGPANGPEEVLDGAPDSVYLIGRIAPAKLRKGTSDPVVLGSGPDDVGTDGIEVGGAHEAAAGRGVPMPAVDDSSPDGDEDSRDDLPQQRGLMIPASMGLRFQVPADLTEVTVTASWGVYQAVRPDEANPDAARRRQHRRTPVTETRTISVARPTTGATHTEPLRDKVVLRVDVFDDPERDRRLVEVALCNDRVTERRIPVEAWLYQTELSVTADGAAVFLPVTDVLQDTRFEPEDDLRRLNLQYRDRLEFAIGRTCSVDWEVADGARRATRVCTTWLPTWETPQTTAQEIGAATVDMQVLASASTAELVAGLTPIPDAYAAWLDGQAAAIPALPEHLHEDATELVVEARQVLDQLRAGLEHLLTDPEALRCFRFMNSVMADQRIHTQVAERRAQRPRETLAAARESVVAEGPRAHSWRTFQLAFILMQLPLITDPAAPQRSGDLARAQLLFFPTGGGKTEAYLGLAAYTFAIRRRQGLVDTPDGPLDGGSGVAVLMRYTLRLLTAQQFQRATTLVCAAEVARRQDVATWGEEPFRIGLWVGTDVSPKRYEEAAAQLSKVNEGRAHRLTVLQIQRCPWCGSRIGPSQVRTVPALRRVHVYCADDVADCPFSEGGSAGDGLPVLTVDEEIYRLAPSFVIATVDKFARLAREGEAASLFGYVSKRCDRHGYVHPDYAHCDLKDGSKHPAKAGLSSAAVRPVARLRPPDLIIQDELHLISGALGTTVGLFEVAIDVMSSWRSRVGGVRPLVVASTATVRNAPDQIRNLYGRDVTIFPPQVLDAADTFFSREEPVTPATPGRRYVGVSTTGVRLTTAEIRLAEVLMAGGQLLLDTSGPDRDEHPAADPYLSLVAYFNATRELAGMTRYLGDDVRTALTKGRPWSRLPRRTGTEYGQLNTAELTSRVSSVDISATLDRMALPFDPRLDSNPAKRAYAAGTRDPSTLAKREANPYDAILATSMLQVGVDVTRLGLMLMVGQPKNTAEYIQASSRVGRDPKRPGLVVTLGNWARPRDLAHFEQFRHYHQTFYARVEALSVTPFSLTSLDRGLDGVLVSAVRVMAASGGSRLSSESGAGDVDTHRPMVEHVIDLLVERIARACYDEAGTREARRRLASRLHQWSQRRASVAAGGQGLAYERVGTQKKDEALMISPEDAKAHAGLRDRPPFVVANSMREVQPGINLLVSPIEGRLFTKEPADAPVWRLPEEAS